MRVLTGTEHFRNAPPTSIYVLGSTAAAVAFVAQVRAVALKKDGMLMSMAYALSKLNRWW